MWLLDLTYSDPGRKVFMRKGKCSSYSCIPHTWILIAPIQVLVDDLNARPLFRFPDVGTSRRLVSIF